MFKFSLFFLGIFCIGKTISVGYAWNAVGHRLVAQIAYNHLTPQAKRWLNQHNHALSYGHHHDNLIDASVWMDKLHDNEYRALKPMHYIDIPYVVDNTVPPKIKRINAVYAINMSREVLLNPTAREIDKTIALRILWHVVGDIHQPLHTITRVTKDNIQGDKGGNLYDLLRNPVGKNLHQYWDRGGGLLMSRKHYNRRDIKQMARVIEQQWSCDPKAMDLFPEHWANESHQIAITQAYRFSLPHYTDMLYQHRSRQVVKKQIALAGCRLAAISNQLVNN